ncbi:hypothetical protein PybrP1_000158 [[Pythium] brassicae (nom. inval.)]|nr:hypothetical protein PybrP1_000158 [[Pythium] brassicae (nom. inval.)]
MATSVVGRKRKAPTAATSDSSFARQLPAEKKQRAGVGIATDRGGKASQEDVYVIGGSRPDRLTLNGYSSPIAGTFGVFDGHGGDRASRYCAEHLFPKIAEEITTHNAAVDAAITNAVRAVDAEFCAIARRSSRPDLELQRAARFQSQLPGGRSMRSFAMEDGSTCLVAVIRDGIVYVGNVGDSRAILATRGGKSVSLSNDQKPGRKDERARLEANGATVTGSPSFLYHVWPFNKLIDVPRVNGALAMSRSIGDLSLKPWITCDPEITTHRLTANDQFLVMATDGLWDVVSSKAAAKIAAGFDDAQQAADALVKHALARKTYDNVTVVVVDVTSYTCSSATTNSTSVQQIES